MSDYIPQELLVDIFSRLPVKSLIRFMSVSKFWRSIISSPDFIDTHLTKSSKKPTFMLSRFSRDDSQIEHFNLPSRDGTVGEDYVKLDCTSKTESQLQFVGACHGLFCLSGYGVGDKETLALWNPSIRRYVSLPSPRFTVDILVSCLFFGFDLKTKDFKVARLVYFPRGKRTERYPPPMLEVYALTSGSWRPVSTAAPSFGMLLFKMDRIYINGACIRIGFKHGDVNRIVLWSFDLGEEVFQLIDTPEMVIPGDESNLEFGVRLFRGMVSVFCLREGESYYSYNLSIWVMREYGVVDSWTKQYTTNFDIGGYNFDFGGLASSMREEFHACFYVESLALLRGSSYVENQVVQAPTRRREYALPTWLVKGEEGEGDEEDICW